MSIISTLVKKPPPRNMEVDVVLKKLIDRFFLIFVITGTLSLAGSLSRVLQFGWLFQQIIHTVVYVAFILGFIIRNRFPVPVISFILFSLAGIDAIANLYTFGLASTGTLMLGYVIFMMAMFINFKTGIITLVVSVMILFGFAWMISTGRISMNFDETKYVTSFTAWMTQISTFIVMVTTSVIATCAINKRLQDSLNEQKKQKDDLLQTNHYLIKSEKKIRTIIETAPEAIITTDLDGVITSCNQAALDLFSYSSPEELIGISCIELIAVEDREPTLAIIKNSLKKNIIRDIEYHVYTKNKSVKPVKMAVSVLRDEKEEPIGYLTITKDISHARHMEEQLRHAEKMEAIGQLAGGIAHDFNNQLTGIIGFAQLLRTDLSNNPEHLSDIDAIIHTAKRASKLIGQLLAFARKGQNRSVQTDIHLVIAEVVSILQRTIDKNIEIQQHLNARNPIVSGDPVMLQSALLNLAVNARDAMPLGGTLIIETCLTSQGSQENITTDTSEPSVEKCVCIKVIDNGIGMDNSVQKKMFNPFFTTKEPGQGTGMGLASVYGTIKSHNGSIVIQSKPGEGTVATLHLPLSREEMPPESFDEKQSPAVPVRNARILLVDDEEIVQKVTSKLLNKAGFTVTVQSNGRDALALYQKEWKNIDLVILDLQMPVMNGEETYRQMCKINRNIRVLLCSGHDPHRSFEKLSEEPYIDFISKPYQVESFIAKVEKLLSLGPRNGQ